MYLTRITFLCLIITKLSSVAGLTCRAVTELSADCFNGVPVIDDQDCKVISDVFEDCPKDSKLYKLQDAGGLPIGDALCGNTFIIDDDGYLVLNAILDTESSLLSLACIPLLEEDGTYKSTGGLFNFIDVNEFTPVVSLATPEIYVPENNPVNKVISQFTVTDQDYKETASLQFKQYFDPYADTFELQQNGACTNTECNFKLLALKSLDYESLMFFSIRAEFISTDVRGTIKSKNQTFTIFVEDEADTSPLFTKFTFQISIDEDDNLQTREIFTVQAIDGDTQVNNEIRYSIDEGNDLGLFAIDTISGLITSTKALDRDEPDPDFFSLTITATEVDSQGDLADEPNSQSQVTNIQITDVNDNSPSFSSDNVSMSITMDELYSGEKTRDLGLIYVTDLDVGDTGSYSITVDSDQLVFDPTTGSQVTIFALQAVYAAQNNIFDYELQHQNELTFTITVTEVAETSHVSTSTLKIVLNDVNDNTPVFDAVSPVSLPENSDGGTPVITVSATDIDVSPDFGADSIRYELSDFCLSFFVCDATTGEITVADSAVLDYENNPSITCQCKAIDLSGDETNGNTETVDLIINLQDINDERPVLDISQTELTVEEDAPIDFELLPFSASDEDQNADIQFTIEGIDDALESWFKVETVTCPAGQKSGQTVCGSLKVGDKLDREFEKGIEDVSFDIVVTDLNTDTTQGDDTYKVSVTVTINDVNDETPEIVQSTVVDLSVREHSEAGTVITVVEAEDPDSADGDGQLKFSISDNSKIDIDPTTGSLFVTDPDQIDHDEEETDFVVDITVEDTASPSHSTTISVTIEIIDINDNEPVIDVASCGRQEVYEDKETGFEIAQVKATDKDSGKHEEVQYSLLNLQISGENLTTPFAIDPVTGVVSVYEDANRELDREANPSGWELIIRVNDQCELYESSIACQIKFSDCSMKVDILDVNDKAPVLPYDPDIYTMENLKQGERVETAGSIVTATDGDLEGEAIEIHYEAIAFYWKESGEQLDSIPFIVRDTTRNNSDGEVLEWSFYLEAAVDLTQMTGIYYLEIEAKNPQVGDEELQVSHFNITVNIEDYNDYRPTLNFIGCLLANDGTIVIEEDEYASLESIPCRKGEKESAQLQYGDEDAKIPNNLVNELEIDLSLSKTYPDDAVESQIESFAFRKILQNETEFELYLQFGSPALDREKAVSYLLAVRAKDEGSAVQLYSEYIYINVTLENRNDYLPHFCENLEDCTDDSLIQENSMDDGAFREAVDEDNRYSLQSPVYYYLVGGAIDLFEIKNPLVPELSPIEPFDREEQESHTVIVMATNSEENVNITYPMVTNTSMTEITVKIKDDNDEPPRFLEKVIFGSIMNSDSVDAEAATLQAIDLDFEPKLIYTFIADFVWDPPSTYGDVFEIESNATVGKVIVKTPPPDLTGNCYTTVKVVDELNIDNHSDTATLQIFIVTTNDQVAYYFHENIPTLQLNRKEIEASLTKVFEYEAFIDSLVPVVVEGSNSTVDSIAYVHFINSSDSDMRAKAGEAPGNIVPKSTIESLASSGVLANELNEEMDNLNLNLYRIGENTLEEKDDAAQQLLLFQILLAVVAMVLGSLVFLLLFTLIYRTKKMNRKIKVLSTNNFGSQGSGMNKTGTSAAPNSNLFTSEGANPMWNADEDEFDKQDNDSLSSGDSVLVGIEDNPEFSGYKMKTFGETKDEEDEPSAFVSKGGMTSNNPLFSIELNDAPKSSGLVLDDSDKQSLESGDLGTSNPNFSFS